jgi:ribose 1,5-bisphosphokinase PhnN
MQKDAALLVLLFGASGSGKTTLLRELRATRGALTIHEKGTDRPPKKYDSEEILCVESVSEDRYQYIYRNYGHSYGIEKRQIDDALEARKDHFIICNDIATIRTLRGEYGDVVRALFLLFDAPLQYVEAVQKSRGISDDEVNLRVAKIGVLSQLFLDNSDLFDGVVVNRLGAPSGEMFRQLQTILGRNYSGASSAVAIDRRILHEMSDVIKLIHRNLQRPGLEVSVVEPGFVFILMAMIEDDPLLDDTHMAIKRAAQSRGLKAQRVDDIVFTEQITAKVLGNIRSAEFIVADLTHERPNVYYEIGYAHAHRKPTVLTARRGTRPHFDIQAFPIIFYESALALERQLIRFFETFQGPE